MSDFLTVLVTGATGKQGGNLARQLLTKGHQVRGLTRNPNSSAAVELKRLGAEIVTGNLEDRASLQQAAQGVDAIFSMSTPFESDIETEIRQGKNVADAAKTVGVPYLVYSSVADGDRHTGVPHFDSKWQVEQYISSLGIPHAIVAPCGFMENTIAEWALSALKQGKYSPGTKPPQSKMVQIAAADIASFAVLMLENRDRFLGKRVKIAGDERPGYECAEILSQVTGKKIEYIPIAREFAQQQSEDFQIMWQWDEQVGTQVDIPALHREYPQMRWHSFEEWAKQQDWSFLEK